MGDRVFIARQDTLEGVKADTEKLQRGLNVWPIGNGTIRRCGLAGGSVSLWE